MASTQASRAQEKLDKLTRKQQKFVLAYFDCNFVASEACVAAGYNIKPTNARRYGSELMKKPHIKEAIEAVATERGESLKITKDWVLKKMQRTVVAAEEQGNHNATLRGLELLAKHLGMFIERQEISGRDGEAIKIENERKVREEIDDFTTALNGLVKRAKEDNSNSEGTKH